MQLSDYLALVPYPGSIQPKFTAWLSSNLQPIVDIQAFLATIPDAFNLSNAVGKQLDILGEILGRSRTLNFTPEGGLSPVLDDETYRIVLQAKVIQNQWNGTKDEIYDFWQQFFPQYPVVVSDNQDMSMGIVIYGMPNDTTGALFFSYDDPAQGYNQGYWGGFLGGIKQDIVRHGYFVPKPAGVQVNYSFAQGAVFAFDEETNLLKGYDEGSWASFLGV